MKLQSSLEFLLVLGIVTGLAVSAVSVYNSTLSQSGHLINSLTLLNFSNQSSLDLKKISRPLFLFYAPSNSTTNMSNILQIASIGCSTGSLDISFSSPGITFSKNSLRMKINGTNFNTTYFTPESNGYHQINIFYNYTCDNQNASDLSQLFTFASQTRREISNPSSYAVISNRSEHVEYQLISAGNIPNLKEFSHCTYSGPFGPAGIGGQCGTTDAWEYSVFSDYCYTQSNYYTLTYCIVPSQSAYSLSSPDPANYSLNYSFSLELNTPNAILTSQVSKNLSKLMLGGKIVGTANVTSVGGAMPPPSLMILTNASGSSGIDPSIYASYSQARNNLYSELNFYNKSEISTDLQSSIDSSLLAYSKASSTLINGTKQSLKCNFLGSIYDCTSPSPFYYIIKLNASGTGLENQTLNYEGSTLQFINK
ncbi:MAG: hypothetical protein KGH71_02855 [Candidatus Micrarchaeota archaeon]|nr:hypothetical protein [Candidatus Micrarchaeota archaeon]